jgi:hypothetical protein
MKKRQYSQICAGETPALPGMLSNRRFLPQRAVGSRTIADEADVSASGGMK